MKKLFLGLGVFVLGLIVLVGLGVIGKKKGNPIIQPEVLSASSTMPSLEVVTPSVYLVDGRVEQELADGTLIEPSSTLRVSTSGLAIIHFPDGSEARIEKGSMVRLEATSYDGTSGKQQVALYLSAGRMWSKVMELATPDSAWEVETPSAVATVRGTAFGTSVNAAEETTVEGSEHTVDVKPKDQDTGGTLDTEKVEVKEMTQVTISRKIVQSIKEKKIKLQTEAIKNEQDAWRKANTDQDKTTNDIIDVLKEKVQGQGIGGDRETKQELRKEIRLKLKDELKRVREEQKEKSREEILKSLRERILAPTSTDDTAPESKTIPSSTEPTPSSTVDLGILSFDVVAKSLPSSTEEGTQISFDAVITLKDGSRKIVTSAASWKTLGGIGTIRAGLFTAILDPSVQELGMAQGAVIAVFRDPAGKEYLGKSPIFTVKAKVEPLPTDLRG